MWRSFFLAIGAYCCLLGVEALAVEKAVVKVSPTNPQTATREVIPPDWAPLELTRHRRRSRALLLLNPPTRRHRLTSVLLLLRERIPATRCATGSDPSSAAAPPSAK